MLDNNSCVKTDNVKESQIDLLRVFEIQHTVFNEVISSFFFEIVRALMPG